jgi:hypothetical protein
MIFGQVMANKSHGGRCRMVAIQPSSTIFRCCVFFWRLVTYRTISKKRVRLFLGFRVFLGSSLISSHSMSARIASRGPARSSHVTWIRALAASKRLGDAISWRGRSSTRARELAADNSDRIAASCRRQSLTSASAVDSAARAAAASRCRSLLSMLSLRRRQRRWRRAAAFRWLASLAMAFACTTAACRQCSTACSARAQHSCLCCMRESAPHAAVAERSGKRAGRRGVGGGATGR